MATNFDLAPPAQTVDGLLAVPIDIQNITASLVFDGATSSGHGDATLDFVLGPQGGNAIFDLRQTISQAWLDGVPFPVTKLDHHDFGGGVDAHLRILESVLAANSSHSLRVVYSLGPPQASTAGSYQPAMTWSAGPRLAFNFGFTDLGAGRYLEAWIPANLIFDQFQMTPGRPGHQHADCPYANQQRRHHGTRRKSLGDRVPRALHRALNAPGTPRNGYPSGYD